MKINLILALLLSLSLNIEAKAKELFVDNLLSIAIESSINPGTLNYINDSLKRAKEYGHDGLLIKLNTPGGLITTTKDIISAIGKSSLPVILWVFPEGGSATSAGAIIAASAHVLVMSPGTNIGAATPIQMSGDIKNKDARDKAINDLVALVSSLSEARGRPVNGFNEMIKSAKSYSAKVALKNKIIDGIVSNERELKTLLNDKQVVLSGEKVTFKTTENFKIKEKDMDFGQSILSFFANPSLAYIFFIIGAVLIYFELQAPGGLIAGALGSVFLILAAIGFQVLPLNYGAMGLILLAFVLFILEIYITSYGLLSLAGLAALSFGSLFLFRTDDSFMAVGYSVIYATITAVTICIAIVAYLFINDLKTTKKKFNELTGKIGSVIEVLGEGSFKIKVNGEIWNCFCQSDLEIGDQVEVAEAKPKGSSLLVTKLST